MGDRHDRSGVLLQEALEPGHALGVEVVRRLVEEQHVRLREGCAPWVRECTNAAFASPMRAVYRSSTDSPLALPPGGGRRRCLLSPPASFAGAALGALAAAFSASSSFSPCGGPQVRWSSRRRNALLVASLTSRDRRCRFAAPASAPNAPALVASSPAPPQAANP